MPLQHHRSDSKYFLNWSTSFLKWSQIMSLISTLSEYSSIDGNMARLSFSTRTILFIFLVNASFHTFVRHLHFCLARSLSSAKISVKYRELTIIVFYLHFLSKLSFLHNIIPWELFNACVVLFFRFFLGGELLRKNNTFLQL